jgi:hypothetical protein
MLRKAASLSLLLTAVLACSSSSSSSDGGDTHGTNPVAPPTPDGPTPTPPPMPSPDGSTWIAIGIDSEDFSSQGFRMGTVDVTVNVAGKQAAHELLDSAAGPLFPHELKVNAPSDALDAEVEVIVVANDTSTPTNSPPLVKRSAKTHFVPKANKLLFLYLEVRCNTDQLLGGGGPTGPTCTEPDQTCIGGACVSDVVTALPDYTADWRTNPPSNCGSGTPDLVVGAGETAYAPLADGDTVDVQEGPQCGHHVWLALDMKNLSQFGTTTVVTATQPNGGKTVPVTAFPYAYSVNGATCDLPGIRFQLDIAGNAIADFLGKPLDITVDATDKAGRKATATRHVVVSSTFTKGPRPCP